MAAVNAKGNIPESGGVSFARPTVRAAPYDLLKQAILSGELEPGQPLVETSLATWCGVSRTPVREALRRLEQDGLVERNDHGLAVRSRSPEEILDLYDTRIVLEATAAKVAAERRHEHDVRALRWALDLGRNVAITDPAAMADANRQFHRAVWAASHNESLIDLLERLDLHLGRYPGTTLLSPGRWDAARDEHAALADAIEKRDGNLAHAIATGHFAAARDIRLALFAEEHLRP
jgi:DNA-binding GntR family transcriptional regulator